MHSEEVLKSSQINFPFVFCQFLKIKNLIVIIAGVLTLDFTLSNHFSRVIKQVICPSEEFPGHHFPFRS